MVEHKKVTFINCYGITLAADMYIPKNAEGKLPAIAVCGPFGAVKEICGWGGMALNTAHLIQESRQLLFLQCTI